MSKTNNAIDPVYQLMCQIVGDNSLKLGALVAIQKTLRKEHKAIAFKLKTNEIDITDYARETHKAADRAVFKTVGVIGKAGANRLFGVKTNV